MKRGTITLFLLCALVGLVCLSGRADDVMFPLAKWAPGQVVSDRKVVINPLELYPEPGQVPPYDAESYRSGSDGTFVVTNMMQGLYQITIHPPQGQNTKTTFFIFVEHNGTGETVVSADSIQRAVPQSVKRPQDYPYSAQASNARFLGKWDVPVGVTNQQADVYLSGNFNGNGVLLGDDPQEYGVGAWIHRDGFFSFTVSEVEGGGDGPEDMFKVAGGAMTVFAPRDMAPNRIALDANNSAVNISGIKVITGSDDPPTAEEPNGSLYLSSAAGGKMFQRLSGAWVAK